MYLEDLIKEKNTLIVNDLETAIKSYAIDYLLSYFDENDKDSKITFKDGKDLDDIVCELDNYFSDEINNYVDNFVSLESTNFKEEDGTCL